MALFQPTNVIPSTLSGEGNGTVDVTKPLTVSWQVNGTSPMVAYRIKIMQNDTSSTLMLDTGKETLSSPFYGADALGNPRPYSVVITAAQMSSAGMTNGYENGYKMTIQQWWNANDSIEQTSASYFITRATPTVTMGFIPYQNDFRRQEYTFEAYYSQAQGDALEWNRWELQVLIDGEFQTVDDTGPIFGAGLVAYAYYSIIHYTHAGFAIGTTGTIGEIGVLYRLKCTIQTENGVKADTGWHEIKTQNISGSREKPLRVCPTKETDAVKIAMPKNIPILGQADGTYSYETNAENNNGILNLDSGATVTWGGSGEDSLKISESPYTISVKGKINDNTASLDYFTAHYGDHTLVFSCYSSGFFIRKNGTIIWQNNTQPVNGATFGVAITESSVYFLMKNGGSSQYTQDTIGAWQEGELQSIRISGTMQFCDVLVKDGNTQFSDFLTHMMSDIYTPSNGEGTEFVASFNYTLYTGTYVIRGASAHTDATTTLAIYRKSEDPFEIMLIANIPLDKNTKNAVVYDYYAKNQKEYEYYMLFLYSDPDTLARNTVATITPCFWNYTVLSCTQNNIGDYIVEKEYRFGLDLSSGSVGNNNNPMLQQNFTRYPLRQPSSSNYRSGTLSAFIGKVVNDQYVDTVNLMDELYALSIDGNTKFLKTRKGQIFRIDTSGPIAMNITDRYAQQPAKIGLPWVEVGDTKEINILGDSSQIIDAPTFSVNPDTMELTMTYDEASVMGENSFGLIDQDLYLMNPGVYDENDFSLNAGREVILNTD